MLVSRERGGKALFGVGRNGELRGDQPPAVLYARLTVQGPYPSQLSRDDEEEGCVPCSKKHVRTIFEREGRGQGQGMGFSVPPPTNYQCQRGPPL
jgi:hypothetical protein